jgi:hypothetical protein
MIAPSQSAQHFGMKILVLVPYHFEAEQLIKNRNTKHVHKFKHHTREYIEK